MQFHPHIPCAEPNQEMQIVIGGPIYDEKGKEIYIFAAIDCFSKYLTARIGPTITKHLDMCIENYGIPRSIPLDQAKCPVEYQVRRFGIRIT